MNENSKVNTRNGAQEAKDELHTANAKTVSPAAMPPPPPPTALRETHNPERVEWRGGGRHGGEEGEVKEMQRLLAAMDIDLLRHGLGTKMMECVDSKLRGVALEMQGLVKEEIGSIWMVSAPSNPSSPSPAHAHEPMHLSST